MHKLSPLCLFVLVAGATAQNNNFGSFDRTGTTYATRGGNATSNLTAAVVFTRHDKESYAGWGVDPAFPGTRSLTGLHFFIQDQNLATQDAFTVVVYTEDPNSADFPLTATPVGQSGNFGLPIGTGGGAYDASANFATPLHAVDTGDVFVGLSFNTPWVIAGGVVTEGCSVWAIARVGGSATATVDFVGPGLPIAPNPPASSSGFFVPSTGLLGYSLASQNKIEPIVVGAGGCAGTITNQALHTASNVTPGTSCMLSGLYPDAVSPPLNVGRADDLASKFMHTGMPDGTPVLFFLDLGSFAPEIPVSVIVPGSTGAICVNLGSMAVLGLGFTATGFASFTITLTPAVRPNIAGLSVLHQSAALDANGAAHASPCTRQVL